MIALVAGTFTILLFAFLFKVVSGEPDMPASEHERIRSQAVADFKYIELRKKVQGG